MRIPWVIALCLGLVMFTGAASVAQAYRVGTISGSVGAEALFAETKLSQTNKTGLGVTAKGEYIFSEHASATINGGYYFMGGRTRLDIKSSDISAIPLKAGARYYLGSFYGAGEVGALFFMGDKSRTGFAYSLGLGDKINLGNNVFDISVRHEGWSASKISRGFVGLRVAYEFALSQQQTTILPAL